MVVVLKKEGLYLLQNEMVGGVYMNTETKLSDDDSLTPYLSRQMVFDEGITVMDFLEQLKLRAEEVDVIFYSSLDGVSFNEFYEDAKKKPVGKQEFTHVEIARNIGIDEFGMYEFPLVQLVKVQNDIAAKIKLIEYEKVCDYANLPLYLNYNYIVFDATEEKKGTELFASTKTFSVFEVIHNLLFEMSFHGSPEMRDSVKPEKDSEITIEIAPPKDELVKLEEELKKSVDEEDYEKSSMLRDKIREMKARVGSRGKDRI